MLEQTIESVNKKRQVVRIKVSIGKACTKTCNLCFYCLVRLGMTLASVKKVSKAVKEN